MKNGLRENRFEAILLFGLAIAFFSRLRDHHLFLIYQGRDIQRAMDLLNGQWFWHGPEISGGGALPGPFFYWLLAIPVAIFGTWESIVWLNLGMASLAAVGFWYFGLKYYSRFTGLLMYFLFLNSLILNVNLNYFWNPSFIYLFQALILVLLSDPFTEKRGHLIGGSVLLALSLQIHYLQAIFLAGLITAIWITPKITLSARILRTKLSFLFIVLPLVPFLLWFVWSLINLEGTTFSGTGQLLGLNKIEGSYTSFYSKTISREVFLFLCSIVWLVVLYNRFLHPKTKVPSPGNPFLVASLIFSLPLLLSIELGPAFQRYVVPTFLLFYLLSAPLLAWAESKYQKLFWVGLFACGLVLGTNGKTGFAEAFDIATFIFLASAVGIIFLYGKSTQVFTVVLFLLITFLSFRNWITPTVTPTRNLEARVQLAETLVRETNWSYETFRERAYIVGLAPDDDFSIIYSQIHRELKTDAPPANYNGVIIRPEKSDKIPSEIKEALNSRQTFCARMSATSIFTICYYNSKNLNLVSRWNNLGSPYQYQQPQLFPINERKGLHKTSSQSGTFYLNECANLASACSVYFDVKIEGRVLKVRTLGDPISSPDPGPIPALALNFKNLELEYKCNSKSSVLIATHLGFPDRSVSNYPTPFVLAPLERSFELECSNASILALRWKDGMSNVGQFQDRSLDAMEILWE